MNTLKHHLILLATLAIVLPALSADTYQYVRYNQASSTVTAPAGGIAFPGTVSAEPATASNHLVRLDQLPVAASWYLDFGSNGAVSVAGSRLISAMPPTATTTQTWLNVTNNQYLGTNTWNIYIPEWDDGNYTLHVYARQQATLGNKSCKITWEGYIFTNGVESADYETGSDSATLTTSFNPLTIPFHNGEPRSVPAGGVSGIKIRVADVSGSGGDPDIEIVTGPSVASHLETPGMAGAFASVLHATTHSGAGADPITALGPVTYSGAQDLAGNVVTNVGTWHGTNVYIESTIAGNAYLALTPTAHVSNSIATTWGLFFYTNASANPSWNIWRAGGSPSAPSVTTNAMAGTFNFRVYDGVNWKSSSVLQFIADETCSVGSTPSYIKFYTTPSGSSTLNERLRITSAGAIRVVGGNTFPTGAAGDIFYHTTSNKHFGYNGSAWNALY